jgi:ABC-2 type transport system ATP-binding protein
LPGPRWAGAAFAGSTRDEDALALQVPSDGDVNSLRAVLDHLDVAAINVGALSVHTPDLDDVFLALTGRPAEDGDDTRTETQKETAR